LKNVKKYIDDRMKSEFSKVEAKALDTDSKNSFSYNPKINWMSLFKSRMNLFFALVVTSLLFQLIAVLLTFLVPDPRYFITTYNGHVYEISNPQDSLEFAIKINKSITEDKKLIRAEVK